MNSFSLIIKNYNTSTIDSDYCLPITNKIIRENMLKVIFVGYEDKALVPMIPLT
jgi:hypothetical protein